MKYAIVRTDKTNYRLQGIGIGIYAFPVKREAMWTTINLFAYKAKTEEEAAEIINFITEIINPKLKLKMMIVPIVDKQRKTRYSK